MSNLISRIERFAAELRHRRVFRAGIAYAVVAWLAVQVAATAFPLLYIPSYAARMVVVLAILGFPVALVLAWVYDVVPGGVQPAEGAAESGADEGGGGDPTDRAGAGSAVRHAVPPSLVPLVGRMQERRELEGRLRDPGSRLVTIVGPGGMGKTRLALEIARGTEQAFAHGACLVPLAGMDPGSPLVPTIAEHLGLTLDGKEDPDARVSAYLREKSLLLVVDNFEQFTGQADALSRILARAPGVKILVTSQERLNLRGEVTYPLEGLAVPEEGGAGIEGYDAADLFVQTARRVSPRQALTAEDEVAVGRICRYVQGVPLAIELAAAWAGVLSCEEVWREIQRSRDFLIGSARDLPERHRSLRAVFETSWQLLGEPERAVVRRLSVFRGGFCREAAAEVAGGSLPVLTSLVEKSILQRRPGSRFESLEILRQYAGDRLAEDPGEAVETARLHAAWYAGFLHARRERIERMADPQAASEVSAEIENVREAWRCMIRLSLPREMERALEGLFFFYLARGWAREGAAAFGEAAAHLRARARPEEEDLRHRLLARQGVFCTQLAEYGSARHLLDAALRHFEGTREWAETTLALNNLGVIATYEGDYAGANELYQRSLALYRDHGSHEGTARSCVYLGTLAFARGDYAAARDLFREALELFRRIGDRRLVATALKNLGGVAYREHAYDEANTLLQESLAIDREFDNPMALANSLQNLGCVAFRAGELERAERYLREGATISREMGFRRLQAFCLNELGSVRHAQGNLEEATLHYREALAIATEIQQMPMTLEILLGFAAIAHDRGEDERAASLLSVVLRSPASSEHTRAQAEQLARALAWPLAREAAEPAAEAVERAVRDLLRPTHEAPAVVAALSR